MKFTPTAISSGSLPYIIQIEGKDIFGKSTVQNTGTWTPLFEHECTFPPKIFIAVMQNLVRNPNINSSCLFRADIHVDVAISPSSDWEKIFAELISEDDDSYINDNYKLPIKCRIAHFRKFSLNKLIIRTLIPRNVQLDHPLRETCLFYSADGCDDSHVVDSQVLHSMVVYLPHVHTPEEMPFYHPTVSGICFVHEFSPKTHQGKISIHYSFFPAEPSTSKLVRTAWHLLATLYKHGQGAVTGYVKRVHHDQILPQAIVQNTYSRLKKKHSRRLIEKWVESTDPTKHVFEDLAIAAFLIELWNEMYCGDENMFPGFVDIGCGNGLLVHILRQEGYSGWGFDAQERKSWLTYCASDQENLQKLVLKPFLVSSSTNLTDENNKNIYETEIRTHNGKFPTHPFIISNHADELTPWTVFLATASECPFLIIPCCSHNLSGARFRAPPPTSSLTCRNSASTYASLVHWVSQMATDCGWQVEKEMLRIPSTRNLALIGRTRCKAYSEIDLKFLVKKYGGAHEWERNTFDKLLKNKNGKYH